MNKFTGPNSIITDSSTVSKRIIKINECPTISKASELQYLIACDDNQAIYFRVDSNSGGGFFNNEWIALTDIQEVFIDWPVDRAITSFALNGLFKGRSSNSPAFLMAVLKEEKIVATLKGKHRSHEYQGGDEFLHAMNKLMAEGVDLKVEVTTNNKPKKPNVSVTKKPNNSSKSQLKSA